MQMGRYMVVLSMLMLAACAKADVLMLDPVPRPRMSVDSVQVFVEEPAKLYRAIAVIEVSDQSWGLSLAKLTDKLKADAAKMGGEAVILGSQSTQSGAVIVPIGDVLYASATTERKLVGKVIVFTDSPHSP
jgi:hypothetical protein